ncbi:Histidine ammonia-lyase [compost metagenome]
MAGVQAHDFLESVAGRAAGTNAVYNLLREHLQPYSDDRPLSADMEKARLLLRDFSPPDM